MNYKVHKRGFKRRLRHWVAFPFISFQIIPLFLTDVSAEIYHRICFPLYGLKCVKRSKYVCIDRHKLKYLTFQEKIGCIYCGYANGLVNYWVQIAAETEKYWCGIMHKRDKDFIPPKHHKNFLKYGDKQAYNRISKK